MTKATIIAGGCAPEYRLLVKLYAMHLGISGLARSLPGGHVEVFCNGDDERIEALLSLIHYGDRVGGPLGLYAETLCVYRDGEAGYEGPWKEHTNFEIDYGPVVEDVERMMLEAADGMSLHTSLALSDFGKSGKETRRNFKAMIKSDPASRGLRHFKVS